MNGVTLRIEGNHSREIASWNSRDVRDNRASVFVWGHPRIASDTEFGPGTRVETIPRSDIPDRICRLFEARGTEAFALFEGNFSVILADPKSRTIFLVVDKFGCDDIYFYAGEDYLAFASHPAFLYGVRFKFDAPSVAFFLAHEGFVPAPFTLFEGIRTVGRARFLRIHRDKNGTRVDSERYWEPSRSYELRMSSEAIAELNHLIQSAVGIRQARDSGVLLSGGVDSSLLFGIASHHSDRNLIAMTGSVKGFADGEQEMADAEELADARHVPHESVVVDPGDESLPDEWTLLTQSWMAGSRVTLPVFHRLARRARNVLGEGSSVLSGQMADTLADNNYTFPSLGYAFRRAFYSPWFLTLLPLIGKLAPASDGRMGDALCAQTRRWCGPRISEMVRSVLSGAKDRRAFYDGRIFGYGEMPGRSSAYFPSLTKSGFERVADWYSAQFVAPVVSRLQPSTFYRDMIELSFDMVMLHLDTRLVFHAFRLSQMRAELPFLDARVVNFFVSMPYSARSILRKPKHVIHAQVRNRKLKCANANRKEMSMQGNSADHLLLDGSLGAHFRDLLAEPEALNQVKGIFDYMDESYAFEQMRQFRDGGSGLNAKFISRLAALESWQRLISNASHLEFACARA